MPDALLRCVRLFLQKHTMKVFNANGKCTGRSRGTTNVECRRIASAARGLVEWSSIWIPRSDLSSEEHDRGAIASIMLLSVDAPGAYGIGAARSRSGIARTWHCSRFRVGSTKISARSSPRLTCSRVTNNRTLQGHTNVECRRIAWAARGLVELAAS